ncbi:hypothetical protein Ocin01_08635 [Orchesella cincta]|uniref:Uncharacterized protein n=1 Tax=Orchesella cincta TaxID=48709 RepID=A0A1D2MYC8_ORCCI|nr:hypothetical protein Ocin01_08635 [Orchesella cincta]
MGHEGGKKEKTFSTTKTPELSVRKRTCPMTSC